MSHTHNVVDTDKHFIIDAITRAITTQSEELTLMQGDHNSEIYTFEIPKVIEGHDMSLCNRVEIHFNNVSSDKVSKSTDIYGVPDLRVDETDPEKLIFSWLVSGNATKYAGSLGFRVRFCCIDENGNYTYKWHTDIFKGITVSDGLDNAAAVEEEFSDVLSEWEARFNTSVENILKYVDEKAIQNVDAVDLSTCESGVYFTDTINYRLSLIPQPMTETMPGKALLTVEKTEAGIHFNWLSASIVVAGMSNTDGKFEGKFTKYSLADIDNAIKKTDVESEVSFDLDEDHIYNVKAVNGVLEGFSEIITGIEERLSAIEENPPSSAIQTWFKVEPDVEPSATIEQIE